MVRSLLRLRVSAASAVFWPMRKMTNSAGFSGATPIRQISRPLSRSFCVIVLRSQRTKNASSGCGAEQRAVAPLVVEEVDDRLADVRPQPLAVGLEHRPLRAAVDRVLQVDEVAPHVDVLPLRIVRARRARAPHAVAATGEEAQAVDAERVQHLLLERCSRRARSRSAPRTTSLAGALYTPRCTSVRHRFRP